ncbi:helix-turn-helix domain-containing protein [Sphingobium nicotianae]|uniref:Helix-turn-helix domain-containing protein n=1 Tax=Sphingobium nicotianae TaxID=2782607 RepID=A0A9X1D8I4_9SPHN|nr:helix-turn-helix domain-containing protein [Sphingobium nicotianae]MBT2185539.1 helix-turn-helix domain-containing protein [Sphingobium nicotianae]
MNIGEQSWTFVRAGRAIFTIADHMGPSLYPAVERPLSAFKPIPPHAALKLLEDADVGVDAEQLLTDLAAAGLIKGYARVIAENEATVRDSRIPRHIWEQIVTEDKVSDVFAGGSVRLGQGGKGPARSIIGIRFDERSVHTAAECHGLVLPAKTTIPEVKPNAGSSDLPKRDSQPVIKPVELEKAAPRRMGLAPDVLTVSIKEAMAILGVSRGTINNLINREKLEISKVGGRVLIAAESIRVLLAP